MSSEDCEDGNTTWKHEARQRQIEFYQLYGNETWWSGNPHINSTQVERKFASILFNNSNQSEQELSSKEIQTIKNVVTKIQKTFEGEISVAIIHVCIQTKTGEDSIIKHYIFRVWNTEKQIFIDSSNIIYYEWSDFIKNHALPNCFYCYPENGRYTVDDDGELKLEFVEIVEDDNVKLCLKFIDIFFILVALIGLILGIISQAHDSAFDQRTENILTIVAVSFIAASGLYNLIRCVRVSHIIFKQ